MDLEQTDVAHDTEQHDEQHDEQEIADELLIEEISIDGMCGVY